MTWSGYNEFSAISYSITQYNIKEEKGECQKNLEDMDKYSVAQPAIQYTDTTLYKITWHKRMSYKVL